MPIVVEYVDAVSGYRSQARIVVTWAPIGYPKISDNVRQFPPTHSRHSPALMLQAGDPMAAQLGFYGAVALATFKALVAIGLFGMVAIGFLFVKMTPLERVVAFIAALCLLGDFRFSDTAGFVLTVVIVLRQWRLRPRSAVAAA